MDFFKLVNLIIIRFIALLAKVLSPQKRKASPVSAVSTTLKEAHP